MLHQLRSHSSTWASGRDGAVPRAALTVEDPPSDQQQSSQAVIEAGAPSRASPCRRRRVILVTVAIFTVLLVFAYVYVPSWIIQSRLAGGTNIALEQAHLHIDGETSRMLSPSCRVFAPKSLLQLPLISYRATMRNIRVKVLTDVGGSRHEEIGLFVAQENVAITSSQDVNATVHGSFDITGEQHLGAFTNKFIAQENVSADLQVRLDASGFVWGWLPVYFKGISVHYTATIPAMNNFATRLITVDEILSAEGRPKNLTVGCNAWIYNPSPLALTVHDDMQMHVQYEFKQKNYTIGVLRVGLLSIAPGDNLVSASLDVLQTDDNEEAMVAVIGAYIGGEQDGYGPAGTRPFSVSVVHATAKSELVRAAMAGLSATVRFNPKPFSWLKLLSGDVVVGGSLIGRRPSLYNASVNLKILNPLPTPARLDQVHLEAYHMSLGGADLYNFTRAERDLGEAYQIHPRGDGDQILRFRIFPLSGEFKIPDSISTIKELIEEAAMENITVGVKVTLHCTVGGEPGFYQRVEYTNKALHGALCYHVANPAYPCSMGPAGFDHLLRAFPRGDDAARGATPLLSI
jgi:hypothetical protein